MFETIRAKSQAPERLQVVTATATVTGAVDGLCREIMGSHVRIDASKQKVVQVDGQGQQPDDEDDAEDEEEGEREQEEKKKGGKQGQQQEEAVVTRFVTPKQLSQQYMVVTCKLRLPALVSFLRAFAASCKTVVFLSTCDSVDFHHRLFTTAHWIGRSPFSSSLLPPSLLLPRSLTSCCCCCCCLSVWLACTSAEGGGSSADGDGGESILGSSLPVHRLHGNIPQAERLQTFRAFSMAKRGVLLSTDVAARGLDLPSVDWIVQYDPPSETAEYVHRVGRTARKGQQGHALLFLLPSEKGYLDKLQAHGLAPQPLSLQSTLLAATPRRFAKFRAPEEVSSEQAGAQGGRQAGREQPGS